MGREGNQAANFADIAVPRFKDLRRLMFYHGRRYSSSTPNMYAISMFKGQMDVFFMIMFNYLSNFSAHSYYLGAPYMLFHVIAANQNVLFWCLFDAGDVPYCADTYKKTTDERVKPVYDALRKSVSPLSYLTDYMENREGQLR